MTTILTIPEVAQMLKKDSSTIRVWCESGILPSQKHGRDWLILSDDLDVFARGYKGKELIARKVGRPKNKIEGEKK